MLLKWWLGIPLCTPPISAPCGRCGVQADPFGDHAVVCPLARIVQRHRVVVEALQLGLQAANITTVLEQQVGSSGDRPADILAHLASGADPVAIDVTVVHPLLPSGYVFRGEATKRAEVRKNVVMTKHAPWQGLHFCPLL